MGKKHKGKGRKHSERSPTKAHGTPAEAQCKDGAVPPPAKRQTAFYEAVAAASEATPEQNAAGGDTSPPRSAIKRVAGEYGTDTDF